MPNGSLARKPITAQTASRLVRADQQIPTQHDLLAAGDGYSEWLDLQLLDLEDRFANFHTQQSLKSSLCSARGAKS